MDQTAVRDSIREKIEIMKAFLDGKVIQARSKIMFIGMSHDCGWEDFSLSQETPNILGHLDFVGMEFRVKAEPKKIFIVYVKSVNDALNRHYRKETFDSLEEAEKFVASIPQNKRLFYFVKSFIEI